jgi:hypothetical protein
MLGVRSYGARCDGTAVGGSRILATILPTMAAGFAIAATAVDPAAVALATTPGPSMYYARAGHTATALGNGLILIAGGASNPSAELYHPTYNTFTITGDMRYSREGHTATPLGTGQALIAGGTTLSSTAELYDPLTGRFSNAGSMHYMRTGHTATRLPNGQVLLAGGHDASGTALTSAEIYNPATHTFTLTGSMSTARRNQTATMLPNGKVLVAGGSSLATAELFDPTTGHFTPTGALRVARFNHTATMLSSGRVLLVGGYAATGGPMVSAELYSVSTGTFTLAGSLTSPRAAHTATLRGDGTVLIVGGFRGWHENVATVPYFPYRLALCSIAHVPCGASIPNSTVEIFHPTTDQFSAAGSGPAVGGHGAARIPAVGELVTGGEVMVGRGRVAVVWGHHCCVVGTVSENEPTNSAVLIPGD